MTTATRKTNDSARYSKMLRTLQKIEATLEKSAADPCFAVREVAAEALRSNRECQSVIKIRLDLANRMN